MDSLIAMGALALDPMLHPCPASGPGRGGVGPPQVI